MANQLFAIHGFEIGMPESILKNRSNYLSFRCNSTGLRAYRCAIPAQCVNLQKGRDAIQVNRGFRHTHVRTEANIPCNATFRKRQDSVRTES
jgi:hypothetical protein